jgi:hypothetical protein
MMHLMVGPDGDGTIVVLHDLLEKRIVPPIHTLDDLG